MAGMRPVRPTPMPSPGVDRNEGAGKEPPHDGADVAGEEACFHAEDDAHYRRDEGEETEMDHARDDRYWI